MRCHAGPRQPVPPAHVVATDLCTWRWFDFGVDLYCDDTTVPGTRFCAEHLIESVHAPRRVGQES